jgi:hypothetical protein
LLNVTAEWRLSTARPHWRTTLEILPSLSIGPASVSIADIGGEEFEKAH